MEGGFRLGGHAVSAHPVEDVNSSRLVVFSFRLQLGLLAHHFALLGFPMTLWLPGLVTRLRIHEFDEVCFVRDLPRHALSNVKTKLSCPNGSRQSFRWR